MLKHYIEETLEPTLLFGMSCALLGIVAASYFTKVDMTTAALLLIGILFAQMSVNLIDDYVDFRRGIDTETTKTRFSGGSSLVAGGQVRAEYVLLIGLVSFIIAATIGAYLTIINPVIIPIILIGALSILFYARYLVNVPYFSEPLMIMNFGLIVVGSFIIASSSTVHILTAVLVALPAGIMVGMAGHINSLPDRKTDRKHGRKSGAVMLNSNTGSAYYYLAWGILSYALIFFGILSRALPYTLAICLIALPLIFLCFSGIKKYSTAKKFEKYMGINTVHSMLLTLLMIAGFVIVIL